jgi:hypothetical protein
MPVTNAASWVPTMDEFIAHWTAVNAERAARGESEVMLDGGCTLAGFRAARDELAEITPLVREAAMKMERLCAEHLARQAELIERLRQFGGAISVHGLPAAHPSELDSHLPPLIGDASDFAYLDTVSRCWAEVNDRASSTGQAPLTLVNAYSLAEYREDVRCFRAGGRDLRRAKKHHRHRCGEAAGLRGPAMHWMTRYRVAVRFRLGVSRDLLLSLPARTPHSYRER